MVSQIVCVAMFLISCSENKGDETNSQNTSADVSKNYGGYENAAK